MRMFNHFDMYDYGFDDVFKSILTPDVSDLRTKTTEDDNLYTVHAELPGFSKDDLEIEVHGKRLELTAKKKDGVFRSEIKRAWRLPKDILSEKIEAKLVDGLLTLAIPKAEPVKPTKILVS